MSGWLAANCFDLTPRQRFFCMLAAAVPDLDGLGIVVGGDAYLKYHHVLGHNLLFAVIVSVLLAWWSERQRWKALAIYFGLFHLHLLLDLVGSGELWTIQYLWPFSAREFSTEYCWAFYSWQNLTAGGLALALTIGVIFWKKRTPLEYVMPKLDRDLTAWFLRRRQSRKCESSK